MIFQQEVVKMKSGLVEPVKINNEMFRVNIQGSLKEYNVTL